MITDDYRLDRQLHADWKPLAECICNLATELSFYRRAAELTFLAETPDEIIAARQALWAALDRK